MANFYRLNCIRLLFLILLSIVLIPFKATSQTQGYNSSAPAIDGKINASEWDGASIFTKFHLISPKSDLKYYDSTIVLIKTTHDAIYFGFRYWPKGKVISKSLRRDRSTNEENEFFIMLDVENKGTNGYFFAFSFLNNQRDAIVYNIRNSSSEWDWVWQCKSTVFREAKNDSTGYIETEIKIPVDKMQNKDKHQIGVDIQMFAYKQDGSMYTYSLMPDAEINSLKSVYKLDLKQPFDERADINFSATPYMVANKYNDSTYKSEFGGEFTLNYNKHRLKSTINTDESTLEADPFQFAFYNRAIFLSEKRPFLSKDLDIYGSQINLFYSRAIEKIDYGFNYTYRSDAFKMGSIYIKEGNDFTGNKKDFFIARPKFNNREFNAGGMFIYRDDPANKYQEKILSFDGFYRIPNSRFRVLGQVASSFNTQNGNNTTGTGFTAYSYYEYDNSGGPYYDASYSRYDSNFKASTSFNSQVGSPNNFEEVNLSGGHNWNYNRKFFSTINLSGSFYKASQLNDGFNYQKKYSFSGSYTVFGPMNFSHYAEYNMPNDFDINGNLIERKNFLQEYDLSYVFGNNYVSAGYYFGTYFGDYVRNPYASANFFFFDRVALSGSINYIDVFNEQTTVLNTRLDYKVFDKFFIRSFFQRDTRAKQSLWNTLFQYEFFAGSNVYFVLNLSGEHLQRTTRYFKIGYEFNF